MQDCEVRILEFDLLDEGDGSPPELVNASFEYLKPVDGFEYAASAFVHPFEPSRIFQPGDRLKFRYRTKTILWLQRENPDEKAFQRMGIQQDQIEEVITLNPWPLH